MKILMIAAENDAIHGAKIGGVGDVLRDISDILEKHHHNVDVVLPDYGNAQLHLHKQKIAQFLVPFSNTVFPVELFRLAGGRYDERRESLYVISAPLFSTHKGKIYCTEDEQGPFAQDATKFALFNAAVCEALKHHYLPTPDVIHLHDWHSACIALLRAYAPRYQFLQTIRTVFTIHNLALQGIRPLSNHESSLNTWFPNLPYQHQLISDPRYQDCFNPMRAGILLSDKIHLVSPSYAKEVIFPSNPSQGFFGGEGLEGDLYHLYKQKKVFGILNGCDYSVTLPKKLDFSDLCLETQKMLYSWISKNTLLRSVDYLAYERAKQWQNQPQTDFLMTSIGRLTDQKMLLIRQNHQGKSVLNHILKTLSHYNGRLIILGSGDPSIEKLLLTAMGEHDNFLFINGYADHLSTHLYQAGDLFFMPSSFEPCGISQMLAMRSGQPCLAHAIGGLRDTIMHKKTGFSFEGDNMDKQIENMLILLKEVLEMHHKQPDAWKTIVKNAKSVRFLWESSIQEYEQYLYT